MKKSIYITMIAIVQIFILAGCDLDETIYGTISDDTFWKSENDIREGLNSAYGGLNESYKGFSLWQYIVEDACTDYSAARNCNPEFINYSNWSGTYPAAVDWGIYKFFWNQISYINKALDKMPEVEMSEESRARYMGEGRALRAFLYFTLVQWFKDIPLITSSTDDRYLIPQESPETIYSFIEKELSECQKGMLTKDELQASGEAGYVHLTKAAAQGLLARTYLVQKKYDECREACARLIENPEVYGTYELLSDYKDVFKIKGFANKECLWSLPADGVSNVSLFQVNMYKLWDAEGSTVVRDKSYDVYQGWGDLSVTVNFYNTFADNDIRKKCLQYDPLCEAEKVMITKYPAETSNGENSSTDFPVLRWADIWMMYAESLLLGSTSDLPEAIIAANKVRHRAQVSLYETEDFTIDGFRRELYNERRREFFYEGCGKRDMIRFGTLIDHIKSISKDAGTSPERYYYLPLPSSALAANPAMKQNSPDYK